MQDSNNLKNKKYLIETPTYIGVSIILVLFLVFSFFYSITFGSIDISVKDIYRIILHKIFNIGSIDNLSRAIIDIVWLVRLPRIILAIIVGMGLSVSGVIMQAVVKNPLADPYILGISSGASLGATLAIMLGIGATLGSNYVGISAFIMAFIVSIMVVALANVGGRPTSTKLLLAGMAISTLCSSFSSFIIYTSENREGMRTVAFWLMGSFSGANWDNLKIAIPVVVISTIFFITQYRTLNLMLLGDEASITLGTDLQRYRQFYLLITSIIIGFLVFNSGIIGFVGLIVPHIARLIFGTDHKKILLMSALIGSILLIWSDVISRLIIQGSEVPVGIIISLIGAPSFVYLIVSRTYGFGGKN
ncbi:FecCD family ABC transporter permease [Senegalia massiliensis]|uniref:FecCD family ABC transporter permease n=1 Tax=Senegalia massiliensis TaxID=1720316 RepID=UPI00102FEF6C|nr:iron ABC transporter permease [Senegalia massiliensis]